MILFNDHGVPHFHAEYGEHKAVIGIESLELIEGYLPRRAKELTLDWAELHKAELLEDWILCKTKQMPRKIAPLQ